VPVSEIIPNPNLPSSSPNPRLEEQFERTAAVKLHQAEVFFSPGSYTKAFAF